MVINSALTVFFAMALSLSVNLDLAAQTANGYTAPQLQAPKPVERGTVVQVREIKVEGTTAGTSVGAILGGVFGALWARNESDYSTKAAAAAIGGTAGGFIGKALSGNRGYELIIALDGGKLISVTQDGSDGTLFKEGQGILMIGGRVVPDSTKLTI